MHVIHDFFLLIWNERLQQPAVFDETLMDALMRFAARDQDAFCDHLTIVLMLTPQNLSSVASLEPTQTVFTTLFSNLPTQKTCMYAQKHALECLVRLGNLSLVVSIEERLERLRKEGIISYDALRSLSSVLALIEEKKVEMLPLEIKSALGGKNYYQNALNLLQTAISNLHNVVENDTFHERLNQTHERLTKGDFSIGVTGVMNAGKSTMLNALLGEEVLGTSVVPETANLTLIRYAQKPYAIVHFWNKKEWQRIEEGATRLKSLEAFVHESKTHFGTQFESFITPQGLSQTIRTDQLAQFTSAKHSDKKCNLVKSVELYTDLNFLKEGVIIVDTPGLDDPVVQREEITVSYLSECDLMIHLMNAAQAATQKDVDFIIDALLYRNVAQLLVVITRIDAVREDELEEVIAYTKKSIEARLREQNKASQLDDVIARIVFLPIAGKLALLHKLGRGDEALALGYDQQKTGILALEAYLEEVLFGEKSHKARLIVSSNRKELESIVESTLSAFAQEKRLLDVSKEEVAAAYEEHQAQKGRIASFLEQIKQTLNESRNDMQLYFTTLQKFALQRLETLQGVLKRRIYDDVSYETTKNKRLPKEERIASMIETAMKDGMVDLIRDYRYEFEKKTHGIFEYMNTKYGEFQHESSAVTLDARRFCEEHLSALSVFKNNAALMQGIESAMHRYAKSDLSRFSQECDLVLGEEFAQIKEMIEAKLVPMNAALLQAFIAHCEAPAHTLEMRFIQEGELLEKAMHRIQDQGFRREVRLDEIGEKERVLLCVRDELRTIMEAQ